MSDNEEPIYVLRASNRFSGMVLRFMANAGAAIGIPLKERERIIGVAVAMDTWRKKNCGKSP